MKYNQRTGKGGGKENEQETFDVNYSPTSIIHYGNFTSKGNNKRTL